MSERMRYKVPAREREAMVLALLASMPQGITRPQGGATGHIVNTLTDALSALHPGIQWPSSTVSTAIRNLEQHGRVRTERSGTLLVSLTAATPPELAETVMHESARQDPDEDRPAKGYGPAIMATLRRLETHGTDVDDALHRIEDQTGYTTALLLLVLSELGVEVPDDLKALHGFSDEVATHGGA